jgi:hypothetical protein
MRRSVGLVTAVVLALAGCGGGESDEEQVRSATEDFVSAFQDEDWDQVCDLMTSEAKTAILQAGVFLGGADGGCEGSMEAFNGLLDAGDREELENFEIETVEIDGDRASVTDTSTGGDNGPTELRKKGGEWLVHFTEEE